MQNVLDISKYVIFKYWKAGKTITNLKLQKILYYIQGYALKRCNETAYSEAIYRWPYGPVVPESYFEYSRFRSRPIEEPSDTEMELVLKKLKRDRAMVSIIDEVVEKSFPFSAGELVEKTHEELPWRSTGDSMIITISLMFMYFNENDPLGCGV